MITLNSKPLVQINISMDEWYTDFFTKVTKDTFIENTAYIPQELWERHEKAEAEYLAAREAIRKFIGTSKQE